MTITIIDFITGCYQIKEGGYYKQNKKTGTAYFRKQDIMFLLTDKQYAEFICNKQRTFEVPDKNDYLDKGV